MKKIILFLLSILLVSCSKEGKEGSSVKGTFNVQFQADLANTIYTSAIFGLAEVERQTNQAIDFFYIDFDAEENGVIEVVIEETALNHKTEITKEVTTGRNSFSPKIKWKYDALKQMKQPGYADFTFFCRNTAGDKLGSKDIKVRYTSINECVLVAKLQGKVYPLFHFMGAYVNEDSPVIDVFLKDVLNTTDLKAFTGYQGENSNVIAVNVINQVRAMFLTLRSKGVKYSSITDTSNNSSNPNVVSQYIRFADEVMNNTQANCVDGTVFLCSALRKVGIEAFMVFQPGHVYLGYYANPDKKRPFLLETTMVGTDYSFMQATDINVNTFNKNIEKYNNKDYMDMYFIININDIRSLIKPIGR
ncbi:hypothetical protein CAPN004_20030 [Capnocytophaga cynodegmi]|uniref:hypothetical protein n=1 Tax=Capnocytophaga cynodegmi TaxID=28189 RepID=UPI001ACCE59D|nr:hypothetical protein [Capnocytophaga cynodegmi]GIM52973.1 hypothetical protein CAPN004_20030 [Capnocytophaga cynodegmi]